MGEGGGRPPRAEEGGGKGAGVGREPGVAGEGAWGQRLPEGRWSGSEEDGGTRGALERGGGGASGEGVAARRGGGGGE